jgi:hypothetical protein
MYGRRALVVLSAIAALYFGLGSLVYGDWFYGLLWDGKFWSLHYWLDGLFFLFDEHTYLVILVVTVAFVLTAITSKYRRRIWPLVDRVWVWLVASFSLVTFATALLVYRFEKQAYEGGVGLEAAVAQLDSVMRNMGEVDHVHEIEPPIDFHYLDQQRINSLYSELTPEMEESERKVSARTLAGGKVGASSGSINGEISASKEAATESELKKTEYTPEKKCIEIMRFVVSHNRGHYYTTGSRWFIQRLLRNFQEQYVKARSDPNPREITEADIEKLREPATKEQEEEAKRRSEVYSQEFENEMESLAGLVIVDGEFSIKGSTQNSLICSEDYSKKPLSIAFRVVVPVTPELTQIQPRGSSRLRVFGTVTKPYGKDGIIELRPLAIF